MALARRTEVWVVAGITLLAAALRIPEMSQSLYGDELWAYVGATAPSFGEMLDFVRSDQEITPPLYTSLALAAGKLGDPSVLIRLPSLIAGIATIPLVYAIGVRTVGSRVAVLAALIAALSPFLAFYSVEARAYSLSIALVAASTLLMLVALDRRRAIWWAGYAVCTCAAMYTHYTSGFALAAQLVWLLVLFPAARIPALLANAAAVIGFLPWLPGLREDLDSPSRGIFEQLAPFNLDGVTDFTARWALGHPAPGFSEFWSTFALVALGIGLAVAAVGLFFGVRAGADRRAWGERSGDVFPLRHGVILVCALAVAGPIGCFLLSAVGQNMFFPRNLASSWPGWSLALSALLLVGPMFTRVVSTVLVVGVIGAGAVMTTQSRWQRPDIDGAAAIIEAEWEEGDAVLDALAPGSTGSPIAETLDVALNEPRQTVDLNSAADVAPAVGAAAGGKLFVVGPPFLVEGVRESTELNGVEPILELSFPGLLETELAVYEVPAG